MSTAIRLATRSSAQAMTQATVVADALRAGGCAVEMITVETTGDQRRDVPIHEMGGQGVFVKEVQRAVLDGRADIAVHSAKDLPSETADGLVIGAMCRRRSAHDALIGRPLDELGHGATIATGSVRRRAQLHGVRPDLEFVELRGNIATRLERIPDGGAIVMAVAALEILGLTDRIAAELDPTVFVPAVGQGCVAVECLATAAPVIEALALVDDAATRHAVSVERAYLAELGSGCSLPVGAHVADGALIAYLADPPSATAIRRTVSLTGRLDHDIDHGRDLASAMRHELGTS